MWARATTTVTIYRGEVEDEWGDPKDVNTVIAAGVLASIIESKMYAKNEVTTQPRAIRYAKMRVLHGMYKLIESGQIRTNDRIYDEKSGITWLILDIVAVQNPVIGQDVRVDLQYVG